MPNIDNSSDGDDEKAAINKLLENDPHSLMTLRGYMSSDDESEIVKLFASIEDLTQFLELNRKDIVHAETMPDDDSPYDPVVIWIHRDSKLKYNYTSKVTGTQFARSARELYAQRIIVKGRLKMTVPSGTAGDNPVCMSICLQNCICDCSQQCTNPCQSVCAEGPRDPAFFLGPRNRNR